MKKVKGVPKAIAIPTNIRDVTILATPAVVDRFLEDCKKKSIP